MINVLFIILAREKCKAVAFGNLPEEPKRGSVPFLGKTLSIVVAEGGERTPRGALGLPHFPGCSRNDLIPPSSLAPLIKLHI